MSYSNKDNVECGGVLVGEVASSSPGAAQKPVGKCLRICTVLMYLFAVSFAAILLSLYYLFLWDPQIEE